MLWYVYSFNRWRYVGWLATCAVLALEIVGQVYVMVWNET